MKKVNFVDRLLAFSIAMTMIFGMSFTVFADDASTLNEKIANAEKGSTIILDKDYTEDVLVSSGKEIIIDLAGHTLKGTDTNGTATIKVEKDAKLTIKGDGMIINNSTGNGASCIFNNGTVIIENGTIKKETGNKSYYNIANHGKMIINGGTILNDTPYEEGKSHASLVENGYYDYTSTNPVLGYVEGVNETNPSLEINGGTFDGGLNTIKNDDGATLVINDASVKNQIQVAVFNVSEATINGGTYDVPAGNDKTTIFNRRYNNDINKGKLVVNGGEFNADYFIEVINNATEAQMGEISITGGKFNTKVGLINTNGRVDITTLKISGGIFAQEPSEDKIESELEKFENSNGEWVVGKKVVLTLKLENGLEDIIENHVSGDEVTLPSAEKEGYIFEGWAKDDENIYKAGDKIVINEDTTLTAKWGEVKEGSGDITKEESGDNSGDAIIEESGEKSGDEIKEESGEKSGDTIKDDSGEKNEDKNSSGSHSESGNKNTKSEDDKKEETKTDVTFNDVNSGDWFKEYIDKATKMELIKGTGNKTFEPNKSISRGMVVEILYRYSKAEEKTLPTFVDVSKDAYYAQAISWAAINKIVNGVGENKFEPDRNITREELATIIYRFAKLQSKELKLDEKVKLDYIDKGEISEFALEAITWCTDNKVINGRENKLMAPKADTTRAEATTMIIRLIDNI